MSFKIIIMKNTIGKLIDIKQSEKALFLKLFYHSFLIGVANSFFLVETSKFFLSKVSISEIPIAYIISGILGILLVGLFKKLQQKLGNFIGYEVIIAIFVFSCLFLYYGQNIFSNNIVGIKYVAYIGFASIFAFLTLFNVGFTGVSFSVFNFSQSKRLVGLLGISEVIASILGFLIIPFLVKSIGGADNLLILAIVFSLISIIPIYVISRKYESVDQTKKSNSTISKKFTFQFVINNPFVFYLSLTTIFSLATFYFVDFSYLISVRNFSKLFNIDTTTIVAVIFCIIKGGELFFSLFTSTIISNIGMKKAGLLLPNLLIIGALLCLISILLFSGSPVFIIIFLFISKWVERVIRKSITIPSRKIMFQVNTPEDRIFLQNNIDGLMMQLSTVLAGIMLLIVTASTNTNNYDNFLHYISILNLVIFSLFLFYTVKLYKTYKAQIHHFLEITYHKEDEFETQENSVLTFQSNQDDLNSSLTLIKSEINLKDKNKILNLIEFYNPRYSTFINNLRSFDFNNEIDYKLFSKLYYENQNYFSRVAIISLIKYFPIDIKLFFLKEFYNTSTLSLRNLLLLNILTELENDKVIFEKDQFFINDLISENINEIFWTDTTIHDLGVNQNTLLVAQLVQHRLQLLNLLLNLLQLFYDQNSIMIIKNIVNKEELTEEDMFFVCELLDNILATSVKKMVIPVFEPISYINRKNKLKEFLLINNLSNKDRLLDILMHDYNLVNPYIKELAIQNYFNLTNDKQVLNAFKSSQYLHLRATANKLDALTINEIGKENVYYQLGNKLSTYFSLNNIELCIFLNWGLGDLTYSTDQHYLQEKLNRVSSEIDRLLINDANVNEKIQIDYISLIILQALKAFKIHQ